MGKKIYPLVEKVECACGCGNLIDKYYTTKKGNVRYDRMIKYAYGHNNKSIESRNRLRKFGKDNPFYRHTHSEELKQKKREEKLGKTNVEIFGEEKSLEISKKIKNSKIGKSNKLRGRTYEEIMGVEEAKELKELRRIDTGKSKLGVIRTIDARKKQGESMRERWKDQEYRENVLRLQAEHRYEKPTSFERRIADICFKYNLPFVYCGDGTFLIGRKNPDFINKKDRIAIEVFYDYYKIKVFGSVEKYMEDREKYFKEHGYKIIFIREDEVMNRDYEKICSNKILGVLNVRR